MDFQHGHRHQQQQMNAGLTRYRSAPSSYFTSFLDGANNTIGSRGGSGGGGGVGGGGVGGYGMDDLDHFLNRFMPNNAQGQDSNHGNSFSNNMSAQSQTQFMTTMKQEQEAMQPQQQPQQQQNIQNSYSQVSQMMYQSQASSPAEVQEQRNHNSEASSASAIDYSNRLLSSMTSNRFAPVKMATGGGNLNLTRYNSSPAGLFADINVENEHVAMRGMGNFGAGNNANAEASFSSASRFRGLPSGQSSSGLMSPISEIGTKGMGDSNSSNRSFEECHRNDGGYVTGFPVNSWDDSLMLSDFLKGPGDNDNKTFSNAVASDNQTNESQDDPPPTLLSRHLSLPNTSVELSAMETLMQDSVLCKIRAKRGCATHPRSIAERVRRTRISERMRKLQDLVPNMDKQTNTSDMLDLAVDYIKELQKQVKTLSDNRANCTCSNE